MVKPTSRYLPFRLSTISYPTLAGGVTWRYWFAFSFQVFAHAQRDVFGQMTKHPPAMKPVEKKLQVNHARSRTVPRSKSNAFLWQSITELNTELMVYFSLTWVWVESFWLTPSEAFFNGLERVLLHWVCSVLNRSESIRDRNFEYVEGILGVCSALYRSESIRDRNFEYVDVIVAVNNPLR